MEEISTWLNGRHDYASGVALYIKYGRDAVLRRLFTAEDMTPFKQQRLQEALLELLENKKPPAVKPVSSLPVASRQTAWPAIPIEDPVLNALHTQWKPLYAEMMNLQARIYDVALAGEKNNDPLRLQESCTMAYRIAQLDDLIEGIYYRRDHYIEHQRLPEDKNITEAIAPQYWPIKLANAQRYVRQYKNKLNRHPNDEKAAAKLKHYIDEVDHYKKLLNLE